MILLSTHVRKDARDKIIREMEDSEIDSTFTIYLRTETNFHIDCQRLAASLKY